MQLKLVGQVHATLTISAEEAYILNHLTSYDLLKQFSSECNKRYDAIRMQNILHDIRQKTQLILDAEKRAHDAVEKPDGPVV